MSTAHRFTGNASIAVTAATKVNNGKPNHGRPWEWVLLRRSIANENWTSYNRIAVRIYPDFPGFKTISLSFILNNAGTAATPDTFFRKGLHYFNLKPNEWNEVLWEIPDLSRDKVTGLSVVYRTQGNEPSASGTIKFYVDDLRLQKVRPDHFEGWTSNPGELIYCHAGYEPGAKKTAFVSGRDTKGFYVYDVQEGRTVLKKKPIYSTSIAGTYSLFDFSEVKTEGLYKLVANNVESKPFRIGDDVWTSSIWKTINFFYSQRCGDDISGVHDACHKDWTGVHNDSVIKLAGGWHDAGDLSQSLVRTSDAVCSLLQLAEATVASDPVLSARLSEEAEWGLQWILRNRFADGFRVSATVIDYWTDNIDGTFDDRKTKAVFNTTDQLKAIVAEATAASFYKEKQQPLSDRCLRMALEDWQFVNQRLTVKNLETAVMVAEASLALFRATADSVYSNKAVEMAAYIMACQQKVFTQWKKPLSGFFYKAPGSTEFYNWDHQVLVTSPIIPLVQLCLLLPNHPDYEEWIQTIKRHTAYYKTVSAFTHPYNMLPASLYQTKAGAKPSYNTQVKNGMAVDSSIHLRQFPVWYGFRGNLSIVLSPAIGLLQASALLEDEEARHLALQQLEWILGKNPFAQNLMYGEGHNYAAQYTPLSGDIVGSLPVGIQTNGDNDIPYWSSSNVYNWKEVWVHPSARWLEAMAALMTINNKKIFE